MVTRSILVGLITCLALGVLAVIITFPFWRATWAVASEFNKVNSRYRTNTSLTLPELIPLAEATAAALPLLENSWLAQKILPSSAKQLLEHSGDLLTEAPTLLTALSKGKQRWLILFENNDELRATGGFIGSYALVTLNQGVLEELVIEDIYDADGQFAGFVHAPPGAYEYLSGGNGLRLPDANWSPDFPTAAQQVLEFFAWGEKSGITGVVALNQELVRDFLAVTGPLVLPDYPEPVTAQTLDRALRSNRDQFFPGSIQKKHLLSQTLTQLLLRLQTLSKTELAALATATTKRLTTKDIQLYATDHELQEKLDALGLTGRVGLTVRPYQGGSSAVGVAPIGIAPANDITPAEPPDFYFFSVESNVGINKANAGITRQLSLSLQPEVTTVTTTWQNQNYPATTTDTNKSNEEVTSGRQAALEAALSALTPALISSDSAAHLSYVNYHRLLLLPQTEVRSITYQGKPITAWDQTSLITDAGESFTQIGFLVVVPEQTEGQLVVELTTPAQLQAKLLDQSPLKIQLQKQSGVGITPLQLTTPSTSQSLLLTSDQGFVITPSSP